MYDSEISTITDDQRPAFILDDVKGADFEHIRASKAKGAPVFLLNGVKDFNIYNSAPLENTKLADVGKKEL
jgi:hypothetical protein